MVDARRYRLRRRDTAHRDRKDSEDYVAGTFWKAPAANGRGIGGSVMRFMGIVGKLAFAAFLLSLVVGLVASFGTRFHLWGFEVGLLKIFPFCLYFGLAGLALGIVWAVSALFMNSGSGAGYAVAG